MEEKKQLPIKKRRVCPSCGEKIDYSDSPSAVKQRAYRARKRQRELEDAERLRWCIEEFMQSVGPCFEDVSCLEDMPDEYELLTDEYEDELQKVEAGAQSD